MIFELYEHPIIVTFLKKYYENVIYSKNHSTFDKLVLNKFR